ncbi:MAG: hypothetical protein KIT84_42100 [Labilithrix sp.]|nr:hypothetical protein [Labilithrix sp.]MCW5817668.1 hypothetical protein [Labilithrix sp.]
MSKQTKMIYRLVDIKQRAADAAETAHVAAHHATLEAEAALRRAIALWNAFIATTSDDVATAADLQHRDLEHKWLRRSIEDHERAALVARTEEAAAREAMTTARIELRRYETWLENTQELARIEAKRVQRLADDEVAARKRSVAV